MGGSGSGCWCRWDARETTSNQKQIDIRWLRKQNYLRPGISGSLSWSSRGEITGTIDFRMEENNMILNYRQRPYDGEWEDIEQVVPITKTPCNYGGYRKWFLCPRCWKRVGVLYGVQKYFLCRRCYNLTYESSNASPLQRIFDKARKLREKLGGQPGLMEPIADRPKRMHHKTYNRIVADIYRLEEMGNLGAYEKWGTWF